MKKGFTLVELMVVLGVFGVITVVATRILLQIIQDSNKTTLQNELRQTAERIMSDVGSEIRRSGCVKIKPWLDNNGNLQEEYCPNPNPPGPDVLCTRIITYRELLKTGPPGKFECATSPGPLVTYTNYHGTGRLTKQVGVSGPVSDILPPRAAAHGCGLCTGTCSSPGLIPKNVSVQAGVPIEVILKLQQSGAARADFCASVTLDEEFFPRNI